MQITDTFRIDIDKDVVRRVLDKHYHPRPNDGGPSWLTFLGHTKDSLWSVDLFLCESIRSGLGGGGPSWLTVIGQAKDSLWSIDLFRCESLLLKSHWVLLVMDQFTRRVIGFAVHAGDVDGPSLCAMFNRAISGQQLPRYLSTDHDPLFRYHRWEANLRVLDIEPIKSVPYAPASHPFVERLFGSVRREYLDQTLFWNSLDLERKLSSFREYFNTSCVHSSLGGRTPSAVSENCQRQRADIRNHGWRSHCGGRNTLPVAA